MTGRTDILVVGGGMAGISLAAMLARDAGVMLIEAEDQPGYHATGRSVAFWTESYGGPGVQPLTSASGPLLAGATPGLEGRGFLTRCGALHIGREADAAQAQALCAAFAASDLGMARLSSADLTSRIPGLLPGWTIGIDEPSCADIDAAGLLGAFAALARARGATLAMDQCLAQARWDGGGWTVRTRRGDCIACGLIVDAAGAWADGVATACGVAPLGLAPLRRTVVQLRSASVPDALPLVLDLAGGFYFKRAGPGRLWLSPHDEVPDAPRDAAPEELDVAIALDRFQQVVDWPIDAVERRWAGLRTFAPDRLPVYGFDAAVPGFFWFAGQGGFGIQTAPAAALLAKSTLLGEAAPAAVAGIDPATYAPTRPSLSSVP